MLLEADKRAMHNMPMRWPVQNDVAGDILSGDRLHPTVVRRVVFAVCSIVPEIGGERIPLQTLAKITLGCPVADVGALVGA